MIETPSPNLPSPNFDDRAAPVSMIVLHYTGMVDADAALARLTDPQAKVSAHYLVHEDVRLVSLVPEDKRAWHAGRSHWRGREALTEGIRASVTVAIPAGRTSSKERARPLNSCTSPRPRRNTLARLSRSTKSTG